MSSEGAVATLLLTGPGESGGDAVAVLEAAGASVEVAAVDPDGAVPSVPPDVECVVCPYELGATDGVAVLRRVRDAGREVPFVLYASDGDERVASAAIEAGVTDYVPVEDGLTPTVAERAMAAARAHRRAASARAAEARVLADREKGVEERERAFQRAYEVVADVDRSFDERVTDLLEVVREALGTEYATLSHVDGDDYTFEAVGAPPGADLSAGDTTSLSTTNCERVVSTQQTLVLNDVERDAPELADRAGNAEWGISCYLGAPVTVDGEPYGTFCFYDREPRQEAFSEWEVTFVDLFSDWVSYELERQRYIDRLAALNDLHSVVRTLTDAVMHGSDRGEVEAVAVEALASSSSYALAWVDVLDAESGAFETSAVGSDPDAGEPPVAVGDGETAWDAEDPSLRAERGSEVVAVDAADVPGRGAALDEAGLERWAAVPMAFEDDCYGILNVATRRRDGFSGREVAVVGQLGEILGLTIATAEREQRLAHERERLEFVNRFIRHNLLNSLNVVEARAGILDEYVDEGARGHLETVQGRTADMIELIETLRSLMEAFGGEQPMETEPVDLGAVVREQVAHAGDAFAEASFELSLPESTVCVAADDLLGEVLENLLTNAVQHNDDPAPTVRVSVTADAETATVHVADDGPGVPAEVLPTMFEKGERGFESPGTGFGLYLVREIVDAYDGEVSVETERGAGATFSVTLPRTTE